METSILRNKQNKRLLGLCVLITLQIITAIIFMIHYNNCHSSFNKIKSTSVWQSHLKNVSWNFGDFLWNGGKAMMTHSNINRLKNYKDDSLGELIIKFFTSKNELSPNSETISNDHGSLLEFKSFNTSVQICFATIFISIITILGIISLITTNLYKSIKINKKYELFKLFICILFNIWGWYYLICLENKKDSKLYKKLDQEISWIKKLQEKKQKRKEVNLDSEIILKTENLYCHPNNRIKNEWIIKNINLSIKKGSFNIIIGPNGSGKSTLIKTLISINKNTKGKIYWGNKEFSKIDLKEFSKKVSYIPQFFNIDNPMTTNEFLEFSRYPYKNLVNADPDIDNQIIEIALEKNKCKQFEDKDINQLSGGQKQKIILTSVLTQETDVIILDEPTSFLDIKNQHQLLEDIRRFNKEGKTIIMILHDLQQSINYADNLIVMKDGEIRLTGKPQEIIDSKLIKEIFNVDCEIEKNEEGIEIKQIYAVL